LSWLGASELRRVEHQLVFARIELYAAGDARQRQKQDCSDDNGVQSNPNFAGFFTEAVEKT